MCGIVGWRHRDGWDVPEAGRTTGCAPREFYEARVPAPLVNPGVPTGFLRICERIAKKLSHFEATRQQSFAVSENPGLISIFGIWRRGDVWEHVILALNTGHTI